MKALRLFRVNTDMTGLEKQVERLADCFEAYLRLTHNYHMTPPKAVTDGEEPTVDYTEEATLARYELEQILGKWNDEQDS